MTLTIVIPGAPVPQGRPRFGRTRSGRPVTYSPLPATVWRSIARIQYLEAARKAGMERPAFPRGPALSVRILAVFACPKGHHRVRTPVPTRPYTAEENDGDNLAKAVMDAGNGVLWNDDGQVAHHDVERWYAAQGEEPFVRVEVSEWTPAGRGGA